MGLGITNCSTVGLQSLLFLGTGRRFRGFRADRFLPVARAKYWKSGTRAWCFCLLQEKAGRDALSPWPCRSGDTNSAFMAGHFKHGTASRWWRGLVYAFAKYLNLSIHILHDPGNLRIDPLRRSSTLYEPAKPSGFVFAHLHRSPGGTEDHPLTQLYKSDVSTEIGFYYFVGSVPGGIMSSITALLEVAFQ